MDSFVCLLVSMEIFVLGLVVIVDAAWTFGLYVRRLDLI